MKGFLTLLLHPVKPVREQERTVRVKSAIPAKEAESKMRQRKAAEILSERQIRFARSAYETLPVNNNGRKRGVMELCRQYHITMEYLYRVVLGRKFR